MMTNVPYVSNFDFTVKSTRQWLHDFCPNHFCATQRQRTWTAVRKPSEITFTLILFLLFSIESNVPKNVTLSKALDICYNLHHCWTGHDCKLTIVSSRQVEEIPTTFLVYNAFAYLKMLLFNIPNLIKVLTDTVLATFLPRGWAADRDYSYLSIYLLTK